MPVNKSKTPTKKGCAYYFRVCYKDEFGKPKRYVSKKYKTKAEATEAEANFRIHINELSGVPTYMTIGDLWDKWYEYQYDKVRIGTRYGYNTKKLHLEKLFDIKCIDFNISHFEAWKREMNNNTALKDVSKNDCIKVLKAMLHFGIKMYGFDFNRVLLLMTKFNNPNEIKEEKKIYTLKEFNQFYSYEDNPRYQILWETLYFCGLRIGEARGLQWKDVDFENHVLNINKQIQSINNSSGNFYVSEPKTKSSIRKIPICDRLYNSLKSYYDDMHKYDNFNEDFYCFGNYGGVTPLAYIQARRRKKNIALASGVKEIRLHDFRHSCASLLINNGANVTVVSKYLGHSNTTETLNTYSHMFASALDSVMDVINKENAKTSKES